MIKDLIGQVFGNLTVIGPYRQITYGRTGRMRTEWFCKCACGKTVWRGRDNLTQDQSDSCGCLRLERIHATIHKAHEAAGKANRTHGMSKSRLYLRWNAMRDRCYNPASIVFKYYGGRGITVYEPWRTFEPFRDWAIANGYTDELTLDRIDSNGNYEPSNCRFITQKQQNRNTRQNVYVIPGKSVGEFCEEHNVAYDLVWHALRLKRQRPDVWELLCNT
jgi:hypothetical protein